MFLVRPSRLRLSRGETWPSRCSPGRKQSPSWPASTRSAGSSSTNRCTPREQALDSAFAPVLRSEEVLFYLPVTKAWLRQLVLALVFICHSSTRGVVELLRDVFDFRISLGTVHNIVHSPVAQARRINQQYDLSTIVIGLLDEIFQARDPVLVGVDAKSTFCFLLSPEEHRDADTWGVRLLELVDQGFAPKATIADFGSGLRAGHQEALPEVPCRGDVFHALYNVGPLARYLENRAYEAIDARAKLERKQATAKRRHGRKDQSLATKLSYARPAEAKAIALADEVALLARWLRDDILSVAGPEYAIRRDLFDFVVAELRARESACPQRIRPVRTLLENQRDNLLAFAVELDRDLAALAQEWQISLTTAREVLQVQSLPTWDPKRWRREAALRATLRGRYHGVLRRRAGALRSGCAGQQSGREPQQPAAQLLLPAAAVGEGLLDVASVLPEPPPVPPQ